MLPDRAIFVNRFATDHLADGSKIATDAGFIGIRFATLRRLHCLQIFAVEVRVENPIYPQFVVQVMRPGLDVTERDQIGYGTGQAVFVTACQFRKPGSAGVAPDTIRAEVSIMRGDGAEGSIHLC